MPSYSPFIDTIGPLPPRRPIPLRRRRVDLVFVAFFAVNLAFVTYMVDLEQLVIRDPGRFSYPLWPPRPLIDLVHWWGRTYDPLLLARPAFFRMTIWIDVLLFGPFYAAAVYAFVRGRQRTHPGRPGHLLMLSGRPRRRRGFIHPSRTGVRTGRR